MHHETTSSRRAVLQTAVSGFALATSGLLVPEWLEEAEAREGAYGGKLGGRHGKNRRGRDRRKRQTHGHKKDKNDKSKRPQSKGFFRHTALTVSSVAAHGKLLDHVFCTFYVQTKTGLDSYGLPFKVGDTIRLNTTEHHRFEAPDHYRVGVLVTSPIVSDDLYVDVRNLSFGAPRAKANIGHSFDPSSGNFGFNLINERAMAAGDRVDSFFVTDAAHNNAHVGIQIERHNDSDEYIEFELRIA